MDTISQFQHDALCPATFAYFGDILPYVCSSLAWQTEKWHKTNINSADRKHSTNRSAESEDDDGQNTKDDVDDDFDDVDDKGVHGGDGG